MTEDQLLDMIRARIADPTSKTDLTPIPPRYGVATTTAVSCTEREVKFSLPPFLRRIYLEVANGGFGPGAGLLGVEGDGHKDEDGRALGKAYLNLRSQEWPERLLPLWDLGDGAWACIDGRAQDQRIIVIDENGPVSTKFTLPLWLEHWTIGDDVLAETFEFDEIVIMNPFTKRPTTAKRRRNAKRYSP
jgi:hypothetical protein